MGKIFASVGNGGKNNSNDVKVVQRLLNQHKIPMCIVPLRIDGVAGPKTIARIEAFQKSTVKMIRPDGRVDPNGKTIAALLNKTMINKTMTTTERRVELRKFALAALTHPNQCQALVNIVLKTVELVDGIPNPARSLIEDLQYILIGNDLIDGRGKGSFFVGYKNKSGKFYWRGAKGFKEELQDSSHQIQHAVAGIVIGYQYSRPVQWLVKWIEKEPQDDQLYDATFPLGRSLNDKNYKDLPKKLEKAIGQGAKK